MFMTCWTLDLGDNAFEDFYQLHETEDEATKHFDLLHHLNDNLFCAAVTKVMTATEPQWMEG